MNVGKSTVDKWVRQLKDEIKGIPPQGTALTPEQQKVKALEKKIKQIEIEKDILQSAHRVKKATALLMSDMGK